MFLRRLSHLLKIMFPRVFSAEVRRFVTCLEFLPKNSFSTFKTFYLALIAASLVSRTCCDVWMIKNNTAVERLVIQFQKVVITYATQSILMFTYIHTYMVLFFSAIIGRNVHLFRKNILEFVIAMPIVSEPHFQCNNIYLLRIVIGFCFS